jgi:hypothetical protein
MLAAVSPRNPSPTSTPIKKVYRPAKPKSSRPQYLLKLKLLAAAFNENEDPLPAALKLLARQVHMRIPELQTWFERRRMLQTWIRRQPNVQAVEIANALVSMGDQVQAKTSQETSPALNGPLPAEDD